MDRDAGVASGGSRGPLESLDDKLNIFALANGLDLKPTPSRRRLEWHRAGLERGILIEVVPDGTLVVRAQAWSYGEPESLRSVTSHEGLDRDAIARDLSSILQSTLDRANDL